MASAPRAIAFGSLVWLIAAQLAPGCGQEIRVYDGGPEDAGADGGPDGGPDAGIATVRFSEIAYESAASTNDEFVELYNPAETPFDLAGCLVQYDGASAGVSWLTFHQFATSGAPSIAPRSYFLISSAPFADVAIDAQRSNTGFTMGSDGSLRLLCGGGVQDQVAWGGGDAPEGSNVAAVDGDQSLERKANAGSTAESMSPGGADALAGNGHDTGDNAQDFVRRAMREPQNAASPAEP